MTLHSVTFFSIFFFLLLFAIDNATQIVRHSPVIYYFPYLPPVTCKPSVLHVTVVNVSLSNKLCDSKRTVRNRMVPNETKTRDRVLRNICFPFRKRDDESIQVLIEDIRNFDVAELSWNFNTYNSTEMSNIFRKHLDPFIVTFSDRKQMFGSSLECRSLVRDRAICYGSFRSTVGRDI